MMIWHSFYLHDFGFSYVSLYWFITIFKHLSNGDGFILSSTVYLSVNLQKKYIYMNSSRRKLHLNLLNLLSSVVVQWHDDEWWNCLLFLSLSPLYVLWIPNWIFGPYSVWNNDSFSIFARMRENSTVNDATYIRINHLCTQTLICTDWHT